MKDDDKNEVNKFSEEESSELTDLMEESKTTEPKKKKNTLASIFEQNLKAQEEEDRPESPDRPDRRSIKQKTLADKFVNSISPQ